MAKRTPKVNPQRKVEAEITSDKKSANLLANKSKNYLNANTNKSKVFKKKWNTPRQYTEKELGIPKLNRAVDPEGVKIRGKKGKKFVDNDAMMRIFYAVNEKIDSANASKLEKARQLEAIREAKRKEMEAREQQKEDKLTKKKSELKKKKKGGKPARIDAEESTGKKQVRFA